ncbi:hypothetical protein [Vulcaniibacterium gelatinicum]|uniref:hypothetical protein n=1 Tax=Vulcaniibacterium gelatinicum TaxID=2598725 RepID=UPI0011C8ED93|nr:hypothetical protein [Vulcaniibacterium gelatinicum]
MIPTPLIIRLLSAALATAASAGCATTRETAQRPVAESGSRIATDSAYIEQVERIARIRGVQVVWINPPVRRVESGSDE